jgi:hypothetical protein
VERRSVRVSAPMERSAFAHGERVTRHAALDRHRRGHLPDGVATARILSRLSPTGMIDWIKTAQSLPRSSPLPSGHPKGHVHDSGPALDSKVEPTFFEHLQHCSVLWQNLCDEFSKA